MFYANRPPGGSKQRLREDDLPQVTGAAKWGARIRTQGRPPLHPPAARAETETPPRSVSHSQHAPAGDFQEPCLYSQESRKFSCQLAVPEGDNSFYIVSLCVANHAGSASSRHQTFEGYGIRKRLPAALVPARPFPLSVSFGLLAGGGGCRARAGLAGALPAAV